MDFETFITTLKNNLENEAKDYGLAYKDQLLKDGVFFANQSKNKIEEWIKAAATGQLSQDDLKWLLESQKDVTQMEILKQEGLALVQKDKLKNALINSIVDAVFKTIP